MLELGAVVLDPLLFKLPRVDLLILVDVASDVDGEISFWSESPLEGTTTKSSEGPMILFVSGSTVKVTSKEADAYDDDDEGVGVCVGDVEAEGAGGSKCKFAAEEDDKLVGGGWIDCRIHFDISTRDMIDLTRRIGLGWLGR